MIGGNLSTINDTTVAFWWMEELGMLSSPQARKSFSYLITVQQQDGGWEEDPGLAQYDLPPWIQLGDLRSKLYLSSYATYWLAVGGFSQTVAFKKAIRFLIRYQEKSGALPGYYHATWIATGAFLLAGDRYARMAGAGIKFLSELVHTEWSDSQIAWALDCLSTGGLLMDHPLVSSLLSELVKRQKPDGSWASEDGEAYAVGATIQALKVLKRYDMLSFTRSIV